MNAYEKALAAFNQLKASGMVSESVEKVVKAPRELDKLDKPKEKIVVKPKKRERRPGKRVQQMGIKKDELQRVQILWDTMPTSQLPVVRQVAEGLFQVDPTYTTTHDLEVIKGIIGKATAATGTTDLKEIVNWIRAKMNKHKVSGAKPHLTLRLMMANE